MSSTIQTSNQSQPQPTPTDKGGVEPLMQPPQPVPSKPEQAKPESLSLASASAVSHAGQPRPNPHQPKPPGYAKKNVSQPQPGRVESSAVQASQAQSSQVQVNQTQPTQAQVGSVSLSQEQVGTPSTPSQSNQPKPTQLTADQTQADQTQENKTQTVKAQPTPSSVASGQTVTAVKPAQTNQSISTVQPVALPKPAVKVLYSPGNRPRSKWRIFVGAIALVSVWVVLIHLLVAQITQQTPLQLADVGFLESPQLLQLAKPDITPKVIPAPLSTTEVVAPTASAPGYGHFLYGEVSPDELMIVGSYSQAIEERFERMQEAAGLALLRMIDAARQDGVWLVPVSGFRDFARQEMLFQLQIEQVGSAKAAARSVAPAGYSEHHTGYAVDLADGLARAMDLSLAFGNTPAFKWLNRHAAAFGFELSFPENNPQGVMYEPWHWRFVGSPDATQTFAQARQIAG